MRHLGNEWDPTYAAFAAIRSQVLGRQLSLFSGSELIWTPGNVEDVRIRFVEQADLSSDKWEDKLRRQLDGAPDPVLQLFAELLFVHLAVPSDIKGDTKRSLISTVLSWMTTPSSIPEDLSPGLDRGPCSGGMGFTAQRYTQMRYLVHFTAEWLALEPAEVDRLLDDPWAFRNHILEVQTLGSPHGQRNALLHMVFPDVFEAILSPDHKNRLVETFGELAPEGTNVDESLLQIREALTEQHGGPVDFYQDPIASQWKPKPSSGSDTAGIPRRAWLVRPGRRGHSRIADWLGGGHCAIGWSEVGHIENGTSRKKIASIVEAGYPEQPPGWVGSSMGNIDRFLNQIRTGDLVVAPEGDNVYVGMVTSEPYWVDDDRQARRRSVDWANADLPAKRQNLSESAYSKLRTLLTVSDVSDDVAEYATLAGIELDPATIQEATQTADRGPITLDPIPEELADKLLIPSEWLQQIGDLLTEKKQLIFYGPPGTGKTYLAQALADHWTDAEGSTLVQFHPSYAYEDFFEGFRPRESDGSAGITFELVPGPLRRIADAAREDRSRPYVLIIDEINRANMAKVFGELYFLLEYRDRSIALQYGGSSEFTLPKNLFVIGTMNTADRSIAFVDAAMRRRFYFIPFFPRREPIDGLLERWLIARGFSDRAARLLQATNEVIDDDDFAIGPSYLMNEQIDQPGVLERIWEYAVIPLLEEHYFGTGRDVATEFAITSLLTDTRP